MAEIPLHICEECSGELVYPITWEEEGRNHWWVLLRCPECEHRREGVWERVMVSALDDVIDEAKVLMEAAQRALEGDMVLVPDDF